MPTILILTANDPSDHLHQLAAEGKEIQRILNSAHGKAFDVVLVPECSTEDLIRELMVPNREIEIVHYAGHAGSSSLRLTDTDAEAAALAEKLRSQGTVKLVFLNGCATRGQVEFFHAAGVPFVFATSRPVGAWSFVLALNNPLRHGATSRTERRTRGPCMRHRVQRQRLGARGQCAAPAR